MNSLRETQPVQTLKQIGANLLDKLGLFDHGNDVAYLPTNDGVDIDRVLLSIPEARTYEVATAEARKRNVVWTTGLVEKGYPVDNWKMKELEKAAHHLFGIAASHLEKAKKDQHAA